MKQFFMIFGICLGLMFSSANADGLSNSLNSMLKKKDTSSGIVDLSNLNVNGRAKPVHKARKTRSKKAVVAIVNGHKIIKKDADKYLKQRTRGKVSNFDLLPKKQRIRLIKEYALPMLAEDTAKKELSSQEKTAIYTRLWMQKKALKTKISDDEIKKVYDSLVQKAKDQNSTRKIPEFKDIKTRMKMQMVERKIVGTLMKDVKIKVINANLIAGSINDVYVSIEDADRALQSISKGQASWYKVSNNDRLKVLQMIAPSKLIEAATKTDLKKKEKAVALANFWMQDKMNRTKVSDKEAKKAYSRIKKNYKKAKRKKKLPAYKTLERSLKMQIAKEKVVKNLMKHTKIRLK